MFQINRRQLKNLGVLEFSHLHKAYRFSVIPQRGAMLLDIQIDGKECLDEPKDYTEIITNPRYKGVVLAPFPNRINQGKFSFKNQSYQLPINDMDTHAALHGLVYRQAFKLVDTICTANSCRVQLVLINKGQDSAFPFPYELSVTYELSIQTGFRVDFTCKNTGSTAMPIGLGWHPYFQFGEIIDTASLQLPPVEKIDVNERLLPTGKRCIHNAFQQKKSIGTTPLDTCFFIKNTSDSPIAEVFLEKDQQQVRFWQETGENQFNYLQLYIPPDRSAIAIEPMTCSIDAFNNGDGLITLNAGEWLNTSCGFELLNL